MKYKKRFGRGSASLFSGKGFYISLAVCLVAVGVTAFFAVSRTEEILNGDSVGDSSAAATASEWGFPQNANANQSGWRVASSSASVSSSPSSSSGKSSAKRAATNARESSSKSQPISFSLPLKGDILHPYSNGELVKSETMNDWRTHDGVDIAGKETTPVKAAADGTVQAILNDELWGVTVVVDHGNGYLARYCGLNTTVSVKKDQTVRKGDVLGSVGSTSQYEKGDPPHLHFCLLKNDKYIDPLSVIKSE